MKGCNQEVIMKYLNEVHQWCLKASYDIENQCKCYGRGRDKRECDGQTLVSGSEGLIESLCDTKIICEDGVLRYSSFLLCILEPTWTQIFKSLNIGLSDEFSISVCFESVHKIRQFLDEQFKVDDEVPKFQQQSLSETETRQDVESNHPRVQEGANEITNKYDMDIEIESQTQSESTVPSICELCGSSFQNTMQLKRHKYNHHPSPMKNRDVKYTCKICQKEFAHKNLLTKHRLIHDKSNYACEFCPKTFSLKRNLVRHYQQCHSEDSKSLQRYYCTICSLSFKQSYNFNRHMKLHNSNQNQKQFHCNFCGEIFNRSDNLTRHLLIH